MSDLKQIRDALESAKTFLGQEILWKESNYVRGHGEKKYSELCVALSIIDRMIETPAPQGWKLVPIEPTEEMSLTFRREWQDMDIRGKLRSEMFKAAYKALLSAAPTPAPTEKVDVESGENDNLVMAIVGNGIPVKNVYEAYQAGCDVGKSTRTEKVDVESLLIGQPKSGSSDKEWGYYDGYNQAVRYLANTGRLR